jgi:hypothetical protein
MITSDSAKWSELGRRRSAEGYQLPHALGDEDHVTARVRLSWRRFRNHAPQMLLRVLMPLDEINELQFAGVMSGRRQSPTKQFVAQPYPVVLTTSLSQYSAISLILHWWVLGPKDRFTIVHWLVAVQR